MTKEMTRPVEMTRPLEWAPPKLAISRLPYLPGLDGMRALADFDRTLLCIPRLIHGGRIR